MTRVVALDTSTWWGSVALVESIGPHGPSVVAEHGERVDGSHAERLLPWIAALLEQAGWDKHGVDLYAATRGPGSFTGIRVGLGTIRGLALAADRPCVGVGTLAAIVEAAGSCTSERLAVLDAGRGEWYAALYDPAGSPPVERAAPWVGAAPAVATRAAEARWTVVPGPGTALDDGLPGGAAFDTCRPAERLAGAAGRIAAAGGSVGAALAPLYVRPPDALIKRARR